MKFCLCYLYEYTCTSKRERERERETKNKEEVKNEDERSIIYQSLSHAARYLRPKSLESLERISRCLWGVMRRALRMSSCRATTCPPTTCIRTRCAALRALRTHVID